MGVALCLGNEVVVMVVMVEGVVEWSNDELRSVGMVG